jgi:putative N-acetylmannosamine-6-phosphate epimerase
MPPVLVMHILSIVQREYPMAKIYISSTFEDLKVYQKSSL